MHKHSFQDIRWGCLVWILALAFPVIVVLMEILVGIPFLPAWWLPIATLIAGLIIGWIIME